MTTRTAKRNIIVGFDGSAQALDALALAEVLYASTGGKLVLACIYPFDPRPLTPAYERERADAQAKAEAILRDAPLRRAEGADVERVALPARSAARGLHELAVSRDAVMLVLGSCHRGPVGRVVPGSVAGKLLHGATCALAVAPRGYTDRASAFETVAVGFDGTGDGRLAVREAADLALAANAALRIVAIVDTFGAMYLGPERGTVLRVVQDELSERVQHMLGTLPVELKCDVRLLRGPVPRTLLSETEDADLLVLGSRGYGPTGSVLLGSVSSQLAESCPVPLLIVPRGEPGKADGEASKRSMSPAHVR